MSLFTPVAPAAEASAAPAAERPSCGPRIVKHRGRPWICTFADGFGGTRLDPAKWTVLETKHQKGHRRECRVDSRKNIKVKGGRLRLTSRRQLSLLSCASSTGDFLTRYTAGAVTTARRFAQRYGRVEIRARLPRYRGPGFHSAMWMYPERLAYGDWPASGEIDINEYRTGLPGRAVPTLHRLRRGKHQMITTWHCRVRRPQKFHTYVLVWSRRKIRFQYDGRTCLVHRFKKGRRASRRPFDKPFYLILNQSFGIGDNAPNLLTPWRAQMVVDRVRVWR